MKRVEYILWGVALTVVCFLASCSVSSPGSGAVADYTVNGKESRYVEDDSRVFMKKLILESLEEDGLHDLKNDALSSLQQPVKAMSNFPADRRGGVNWVTAIDQGIINPRMSLRGDSDMNVMDMDIIFKDTGSMPWVRFPHLAHTRWLDCSNCHPKIFIPQRGGNPNIGMDAIIAGKYCGRCHDKVAFPLWTCERCHSVTHAGSPEAWWRAEDGPYPPTAESKAMLKELQ